MLLPQLLSYHFQHTYFHILSILTYKYKVYIYYYSFYYIHNYYNQLHIWIPFFLCYYNYLCHCRQVCLTQMAYSFYVNQNRPHWLMSQLNLILLNSLFQFYLLLHFCLNMNMKIHLLSNLHSLYLHMYRILFLHF